MPYDSMEMRPNKTTGAPGRTNKFLDTAGCPDCLSWPFGYGGSFTTFALAWAAPPVAAPVQAGDGATYLLTVTNSGALTGDVVVICYVAALGTVDGVSSPPLRQLWEQVHEQSAVVAVPRERS